MQFSFGAGTVWVIPAKAGSTPLRVRVLQSASVQFTRKSSPLMSTEQTAPLGTSVIMATIDAEYAQFSGHLLADSMFGSTISLGTTAIAADELHTIPGSPFQVTVANAANFSLDLGVANATNGVPLLEVPSGTTPASGQYSQAAGVYTFASAGAGASVLISYLYAVPGSGETVPISNLAAGSGVAMKTVLTTVFKGLYSVWTFNNTAVTDSAFKTSLEDFSKPTLRLSAWNDGNDALGTIAFAEKA